MARQVDEIQAEIITNVQAQPELAEASSTSRRAIWPLWTFITATAIATFEQLLDLFKTNLETEINLAAPQTSQWLQDKVFKFQYSATDPQVLQLIDLVPQYPTIRTDLYITTRCSVKAGLAGAVNIKVAKNEPPEAFAVGELSALQSYVTLLGVAGISYSVLSTAPDKIYIQADVYYNGAYVAIIQANVIAAINTFLSELPFDGSMRVNDLESAMRGAEGVNDVVLSNVIAREDMTPIAGGTYLVIGNQFIGRLWPTVSGYIVTETTSGSTINDTLNFIAE